MPLHLLGKKTWNVYNADNIARVKRDEAEAREKDAEVERRNREHDGQTRLALLRGEDDESRSLGGGRARDEPRVRSHKKSRLDGKDDTDRDIRFANQRQERERPLTDKRGHIDLIQRRSVETTPSAPRGSEVDEGVRLRDATGYGKHDEKLWYNSASAEQTPQTTSKDVWGNEDPRRKERDQRRLDANDPLAAMKKGVKQLRQAESHRKEWMEQRERDLYEVGELARRRERDEDTLDGFDLDTGYADKSGRRERNKTRREHRHHRSSRHRHHHSHRSRSRSPDRKERRHSSDALSVNSRTTR
jgi:hypothetical protein